MSGALETTEEFGNRFVAAIDSAGLAILVSVGHQTGLLDTMAGLPPATSMEIAEAAGLEERYVREWLGGMTTGQIVEYDAGSSTYSLPAHRAGMLTRAAGPDNLAVIAQFVSLLGEVEQKVIRCFREGGGVPYSEYPRFHKLMAEMSGMVFDAALIDVVLPLVDVTACGVCHTDLTYREGGINDEYPFLLGHEAAGIIEAVGPGVTAVEPGDFVILNWRAVCGQCRACKRGRPRYCFDTFNAEQKMTLTDGTELTAALGIGAFADKTLVHSGQCTKVDPAADPAVAGLLGCGVMAGLGAAINTGGVTRDDTVAVIGCGGVGDAAIAGAALVGAKRIIAVDTDDTKLDWARTFGATHTVNAREVDVVQAIGGLTDGFGADVVIDAVGRPETYQQAFYARDLAGTVVLVGVPTPDMRLDMPLVDFFSHGGALKSSWYGDCLPESDFPTLIDLYLQGRLPLQRFVSERIGLEDVEEAFHKMHGGKVLRSVVML